MIAIFLTFGTLLTGCSINGIPVYSSNTLVGSGKTVTEPRNVSDLSAVAMYGSGQLIVERGEVEALTVTADDNLLPYLTSEVQSGKLVLSTKPFTSISPRTEVVYRLTVKKLDSVESLGSGSVDIKDVNADKFMVDTKGSGNVKVSGKVAHQEVSLFGSGDYIADNLDSRSASVHSFGSGSATVRVSDSLDVRVTGSGNVGYYGSPSVSKSVLGSGRVFQR